MMSFLLATSALAGVQASQPAQERAQEDDAEAIVITGHVIEGLDLLAGSSVIEGVDLQQNLEVQVGDMLASVPGVSATSFTPGSSRPVLRGFSGERVRVLNDGLGAIDVANTSADHATTIDPLTAERIEIIRGPASLIFGSQAIGGAVNVVDRRIPRVIPDDAFHVDGLAQYSSANDGVSLGGAVDVKLGSGFVLHADASWLDTDDLETGGYILSPSLRAEVLEEAAEEFEEGEFEEAEELEELAAQRGTLFNSAVEQWSGAIGLSYIGDRFQIGGSYSIFDTFYGVPLRPGAGHHHGEEEGEEEEGEEEAEIISIDLRQERFDGRARLELDGFFESATLRFATADYEHVELEGDEVGTRFLSDGVEGRLELKQRDANGWHGAFGAQYYGRDFDAIGAEAFVPANSTDQWGFFVVQEYQPNRLGIEGAARIEFTDVESDVLGISRDFTAFSAALGANYELSETLRGGINVSRAERAPSAEELFSDGPHIATQAFEVGDPDLDIESSWGGEIFLRHEGERFAASATLWANWFDNFIYELETGEEEDELPVFQYRQQDADYWGVELEASALVYDGADLNIRANVLADYVRATLDDGTPVPRIPPLRFGAGIDVDAGRWFGGVDVEWVDDQDRTAPFETATDGHTLVNAALGWKPFGDDNETTVLLSANNIFDVDARRHASFTKDFVPLAGRDIRVSARFSF
ncbi:TonB-dependent receptor [Sphingomicrobium flavum]|uniref:TonB-dependent receptor n=1 Tax=Sphingomicrobium flavum TaxID=1229164 RepID=UPI0021ADC103|nr:TonB-dependent receptor [Sphingomicrobium flavum]